MDKPGKIKELLNKVLRTYAVERAATISSLQDLIWEEPAMEQEALQDILTGLAADLNFYEADERDRDLALGYYGNERLLELVHAALEKIESAAGGNCYD